MNCKYSYYKSANCNCIKMLACDLINDLCPHARKIENQWTNSSSYKSCKEYGMSKNGNRVRFVKGSKLYVENYNEEGNVDSIEVIDNPYDYEPQFVEIKKVKDKFYVKGFEPKKRRRTPEKEVVEVIKEPIVEETLETIEELIIEKVEETVDVDRLV